MTSVHAAKMSTAGLKINLSNESTMLVYRPKITSDAQPDEPVLTSNAVADDSDELKECRSIFFKKVLPSNSLGTRFFSFFFSSFFCFFSLSYSAGLRWVLLMLQH